VAALLELGGVSHRLRVVRTYDTPDSGPPW
jgi:hypothetical protein